MKKGKQGKPQGKQTTARSQLSLRSSKSSKSGWSSHLGVSDYSLQNPLDQLIVKIMSLRLSNTDDTRNYSVDVNFFEQRIFKRIIKPIWARDPIVNETCLTQGAMNYDPADHEKMCLFADHPLVVEVQAIAPKEERGLAVAPSMMALAKTSNVSVCNVDILPLFIGQEDTICVKKRLEPLIQPHVAFRSSWCNLPLITMEISVKRDPANTMHHKLLEGANFMKLTLVASYNNFIPWIGEQTFIAASKMPLCNSDNSGLVIYNSGRPMKPRFDPTNFYPKWECLRTGDTHFVKNDDKFVCSYEDFMNPACIPLRHFMDGHRDDTTVWSSFHRSLMLEDTEKWLERHIIKHQWPLEVHIYHEQGGYSFMAFLDLFRLLYPGEDTIRMAVPLQWVNAAEMMEKCGNALLLTPIVNKDKTASGSAKPDKKKTTHAGEGTPTTVSVGTSGDCSLGTGGDGEAAFVVVEVQLARPLRKPAVPPYIANAEIEYMLKEIENQMPMNRMCTARGQLSRNWQNTMKIAHNSLRRVPHYGMTELCAFGRQLSVTRTRVELHSSTWQDAAVYVNNNFVVSDYVGHDGVFEEMVLMAHACLMRSTTETLAGVEEQELMPPAQRAARHARQMQDVPHAVDLFLQVALERRRDPAVWRELSTCLKDVDIDQAAICLHKAVLLDPRDPISLISMGCMAFDEDAEEAEPFFEAVLRLHPYWTTGWVIVCAYYIARQHFDLADQIMKYVKVTQADGMSEYIGLPRTWESELGDWWEPSQLLSGMNRYLDAADLLLRLRAISLAEVCLSRALCDAGESAAYFHLVALCSRLRGDLDGALCHLTTAIEKFGDISYVRALHAECLHMLKDCASAMNSFAKTGPCSTAFSTLLALPVWEPQRAKQVLVELVRRLPSAYAWMALADNWLQKPSASVPGIRDEGDVPPSACAVACAVQALRWDRSAARAWHMLAKLVKPRARRHHCRNMAILYGYRWREDKLSSVPSDQSLCFRLGKPLKDCRCHLTMKLI